MQQLSGKYRERAFRLYLVLAALFVTSLVTCNLIFLKFFQWDLSVLGIDYLFVQSVGLLPYPVTFLITDIISEVYGGKKANWVVFAGLAASVFMLLIVYVALLVPVYAESPVQQDTFAQVFGLSGIAVAASMTAYLFAQFIDVRIFHFWKKLTNGKHLWLRNNASTILSQLVDSFLVVYILYSFDKLPVFFPIFINGFLFKVVFALLDTPVIYGVLYGIRKYLGLKFAEEVEV